MNTEYKYIPEPAFFDFETFKQTLLPERYEKNTFIQNLFYRVQFPFEEEAVTKVIQLYRLGTVATGYRAGAITFPFIDIKGNVRAVQVKQFDEQNHTTGTDFLHSIPSKFSISAVEDFEDFEELELKAYTKQDKRISCLFGEHLLNKYPNADVYLFEAPEMAIYAALYFGFPERSNTICLTVCDKSNFSFDKLKVLQGRVVYVFPDLSKDGNTFKDWENKAEEYESRLSGTRFIVSDLAPERDKSEVKDLADYLIKQDWRLFGKQPEPEKVTKVTHRQNIISLHAEPVPKVEVFETERIEQPQSWSNDIAELENYFTGIELPTGSVKLNSYSTITNCAVFVENHFAAVKANNGNRTFLPFLYRLQELKQVLTTNFN